MGVALRSHSQYVDFFQQTILRALRYWQDHAAVQQIDVPVLDRERETVLDALTRSMDFDPAWPVAKTLIVAFASYMERRGHWEAWRQVLERAIATAQRVGDVDGETTMTALLARLSQRQSRPRDVVKYYRRVIRLAKRNGNRFEEARACSNLGYAYVDGGRWWRAEVLCLHALTIFEELGSEHGLAHTHNHLGLLYTRQQRVDAAKSNLTLACQLWESQNDMHSLINGYMNLGMLSIELNQSDRALEHLYNASKVAEVTGELTQMARIWNNMSTAFLISENWPRAEKYAKKAERLFRDNSDYQELAFVCHNLGLIFLRCGKKPQATRYFEESLRMYQVVNDQAGAMKLIEDINSGQSIAKG